MVPGGQRCALGLLYDKLIIRGPQSELDKLKQDSKEIALLQQQDHIVWVPEGPAPSDTIVAIDFDKTLCQTFLWADLGGLSGAEHQL